MECISKKLYSDQVQALWLCNSRRSEWEIIVCFVFRHLALIAVIISKSPHSPRKISAAKCYSSFKRFFKFFISGFQKHLSKFVEKWALLGSSELEQTFFSSKVGAVCLVRWPRANQLSLEDSGTDRWMIGSVHVYGYFGIHTNEQKRYEKTLTWTLQPSRWWQCRKLLHQKSQVSAIRLWAAYWTAKCGKKTPRWPCGGTATHLNTKCLFAVLFYMSSRFCPSLAGPESVSEIDENSEFPRLRNSDSEHLRFRTWEVLSFQVLNLRCFETLMFWIWLFWILEVLNLRCSECSSFWIWEVLSFACSEELSLLISRVLNLWDFWCSESWRL